MIRVLVVDDHPLVRSGLAQLLETTDDLVLVGEAADGAQAVALVARHRPDVVLMDLAMPVMDGVAATRAIVAAYPETRVLVLSSSAERRAVLEAIDAGASGYLLKDGEMDELLRATRAAARGEAPLAPRAAQAVLSARPARRLPDLTERERDVMRLVVQGLRNKEVAARLGIGEKTVKAHLTRIYERFGLVNRREAIAAARRSGFGEPLGDLEDARPATGDADDDG